MSETHATIKQIAGSLAKSASATAARAQREEWTYTEQAVRGGKQRMYLISSLPVDVRGALVKQLLGDQPEQLLPAPTETRTKVTENSKSTAQLHDWQRDIAIARKAIVDECLRIGAVIGNDRSIQNILRLANAGELPDHLQRLVPVANARSGKEGQRTISRTSLYRWIKQTKQGFAALAPAAPKPVAIPAWAPTLVNLWRHPQKWSLSYCVERLAHELPDGIDAPSYDAAHRFMKKLGNVDRERGRVGPQALKSLRPFVRRDTSTMWPTDAYTADGHTFDAEIEHPAHRKAFRPEITTVLDIATRRAVGWSAGLAESTWAVLDAQRNAVQNGGVPALWYVDRGSGYRNAAQSDEVIGFAARLGITITHSLPYNSQARGLMERAHKSVWVRAAKLLPTYMGAPMDREAKHNVFKLVRADLKTTARSPMLMPWANFLTFCQDQINDYNTRPHSSLPKIRDDNSGLLRHQTPNEAWRAAVKEGWQPTTISAEESDDLFRPQKQCRVSRGEVRLFNNIYFSKALEEFHGEWARVGYDIHDASRVWVRTMTGRLICVAEWDANKRDYFPKSVIDQAAEKRAAGRIARAQVRIDEAQDELNPPRFLEHQVTEQLPPMQITPAIEAAAENVIALQVERARPFFQSDAEKYRWLLDHGVASTVDDERWLVWYRQSDEWADLFGEELVAQQ